MRHAEDDVFDSRFEDEELQFRAFYVIVKINIPADATLKSVSNFRSIDSPLSRPYRFKFGNLSCKNWSKTSLRVSSSHIRLPLERMMGVDGQHISAVDGEAEHVRRGA